MNACWTPFWRAWKPAGIRPVKFRLLLGAAALLAACLGLRGAQTAQARPGSALHCPPLAAPSGNLVAVDSVEGLVYAVEHASPGDTILIADGTYALNGAYLYITVPNVTLRSASGNRSAVILDGNYQTTEIILASASNITIADLTLREAYYHPIHITTTPGADTLNTLIYNVHIVDPGEQAIKINPGASGTYVDTGSVACSTIELTAAGRSQVRNNCYTGGVDAHQARGWQIRDNRIQGFWCAEGLSEHAVHFWVSSRDTRVERNLLLDNARGIGFGMATAGTGRTYPDSPCPEASGYVDHYGGLASNNILAANSSGLFASEYGFDCGICLWNACGARVLHNTVYTADPAHTFSAIEWRFANTSAEIANNLSNHSLRQRDGATALLSGNLENAQSAWFAGASSGDLHLLPSALPAIDQVAAPGGVFDDYDGDLRPAAALADIGADESNSLPLLRFFLPLVSK